MSAEARQGGSGRHRLPAESAAGDRPIRRLQPRSEGGAAPDDQVAETAEAIRALTRRVQLAYACAVGELVIEHLYAGDREAWRNRGPKCATLRALVQRLEEMKAMSAPTLYRCLAVHQLVAHLGGVSALKHVSATHFYAVLPLRSDPELQERLLREADCARWTTRQLEARVRRARGRPQAGGVRGGVQALAESIARDVRELRRRVRAGEVLRGPAARERVFATVMEARAALDDVHAQTYPKGGHRDCPR